MDYVKIRFGRKLENSESESENTLKGVFRSRPAHPMFITNENSWSPQVDISETEEEIIIRAEIAGVEKKDLNVEVNSRAVRLYGTRLQPLQTNNSTYRLAEIQYGKFKRTLYLPALIDPDVVSSSYANGLLLIRLAKASNKRTVRVTIEDG
jgi:HSP20 family protein